MFVYKTGGGAGRWIRAANVFGLEAWSAFGRLQEMDAWDHGGPRKVVVVFKAVLLFASHRLSAGLLV
jgi:hypothetical protein